MQGFMSVNRMFNDLQPTVGADPRVCPFEWTVDLGAGRHGGGCPCAWSIAHEEGEKCKENATH